jgi:hypothetical protein
MTTGRHHLGDDPQPDPRVAVLLAAAAAPTEPGPQPGEDAALAAFRAAVPAPTRRIRMLPSLKATAIAATATGALMVGGVAAAATGTLPGAASDTARAALAKVGVTVAGPADASGTHSATHGSAAATAAAGTTGRTAATVPSPAATASAHGKAVSELATTTTLTGRDKGVAISTLASGGKARHGEHPTPTATETASATGQATATAHRHKPTTAPTHSPGTH